MNNDANESNGKSKQEDSIERDILIYNIFLDAYQSEWQRFRDVDNKASNIVGFVGVIFGLMLVVATSNLKEAITYWEFISFSVSSILFLITFSFGLCSLYLRPLVILPGLNNFRHEYVEKYISREYILGGLITKLADATKQNHKTINNKAKHLEYSFLTFGAAIVFTVTFILDYFLI